MENKHEYLREQYPEFVSINQLYKICHIAKRTAVYLLRNGVIPYIDTGKITWKYKIAIDDVIKYLYERDETGSKVPRGAANNKKKYYYPKKKQYQATFQSKVAVDEKHLLSEYFQSIFSSCEDVITPEDAAVMLGFTGNTLRRKISVGDLQAIEYGGKYLIPKVYLMEFLSSSVFLTMSSPSDTYKELLEGFVEWKVKNDCRSTT